MQTENKQTAFKQGVLFYEPNKVQKTRQLILEHSFLTGFEKLTEQRKMKVGNLHLSKGMKYTEMNEVPIVKAYNGGLPTQLTRFNELSHHYYKSGVHFFQDDYTFSCLWNRLEYYTMILAKYRCVIAPDFSTPQESKRLVVVRKNLQ